MHGWDRWDTLADLPPALPTERKAFLQKRLELTMTCYNGITFCIFPSKFPEPWALRDGSELKSTYFSSKGPVLGSQHLHSDSHSSVTPVS